MMYKDIVSVDSSDWTSGNPCCRASRGEQHRSQLGEQQLDEKNKHIELACTRARGRTNAQTISSSSSRLPTTAAATTAAAPHGLYKQRAHRTTDRQIARCGWIAPGCNAGIALQPHAAQTSAHL